MDLAFAMQVFDSFKHLQEKSFAQCFTQSVIAGNKFIEFAVFCQVHYIVTQIGFSFSILLYKCSITAYFMNADDILMIALREQGNLSKEIFYLRFPTSNFDNFDGIVFIIL